METPDPDLSRMHTRLVARNRRPAPPAAPRQPPAHTRPNARDPAAAFGGLVAGVATVASAIGGATLAQTPTEAIIISFSIAGITVGIGALVLSTPAANQKPGDTS